MSTSVLIEQLKEMGWSEAAAQLLVKEAMAEAAARRRQRKLADLVAAKGYNEWLAMRFPNMVWDRPFQRYICEHIDAVLSGRLRKLIINLPPRVGKSEMVTIRLPVRWLEQHPTHRIIIGAYNHRLAKNFTSRSLALYRAAHPGDIRKEAEDEWENKAGGSVLAVGVGSGVTGRGADLLIIDDPVRGYEDAVSPAYQEKTWQWWLNDFSTRRNSLERTPVIIIATRWDQNDLVGRILSSPDGGEWKVISLPALAKEGDILGRAPGESLWPERLPEEELLSIAATMGVRYRALYDQEPAPARGILFDVSYFRPVEGPPPSPRMASVRYWDLAASEVNAKNLDPDYTVGVLMHMHRFSEGPAEYYIEHIARIRANPGRRNEFILATALADRDERGNYLQVFEETSKAEIDALRSLLSPYEVQVASVRSRLDKVTRTTNMRASFAQGMVTHYMRAPHVDEMMVECLSFPSGRHDDIVDAMTGAHTWLTSHSLIVQRR